MVEDKKPKRIELSLAAARYLFPVYLDPINNARNMFANKLLKKMLKK